MRNRCSAILAAVRRWLDRRPARDRDAEMAEEMRLHLEHRAEQRRAEGLSDREARAAALRQFGSVDRVKLIAREQRRSWRLATIARDAGFGVRLLGRAPGFAITAIVTLALGVGANVAMFSIVRAVLIDELPYREPDRVVSIAQRFERMMPQSLTADDIEAVRAAVPALQTVAGATLATSTVRGDADPERVRTNRVLPEFFQVFGVAPAIGRWFGAEDFHVDAAPAVISDGLWRRQFAQRQAVIGQTLRIDGRLTTVVGVMPAGFVQDRESASGIDVWTPLVLGPRDAGSIVLTVARIGNGASLETAHAQVSAAMRARQSEGMEFVDGMHRFQGMTLEPIGATAVAAVRPGVLMLQGIAGLLVLITCANLANMFLAHVGARRREFGVRTALGAARARVVGQLLTEAALIAIVGGLVGAAVAWITVPILAGFAGTILPGGVPIAVGVPELLLGLALASLCALIFAGLPAWLASGADPINAMRGGSQTTTGRGVRFFRSSLVAVQVLLALVVLTGAGLLVRSFARVIDQPLGFDARGLVTGEIEIPASATWRDDARRLVRRLDQELRSRVGSRPFVFASDMPYDAASASRLWTFDGTAVGLPDHTAMADSRDVQAGFFEMMNIRVLSGRALLASDSQSAEPVAVVNETFVRRFARGGEVIGGRLRFHPDWPQPIIVGVVADTRNNQLVVAPREAVYTAIDQMPRTDVTIAIRGASVDEAGAAMRAAVRAIDPEIPVTDIGPMSQKIADRERRRRFYLLMLAGFGVIAGALAAVGIYGVVSHVTVQRRREMSIRLALGARPRNLVRLVVAQGLRPVVIGLVGGVITAWWTGRALQANAVFRSQLFQTTAHDPLTFTVVAIAFLVTATVACWIPARRATVTSVTDVLKAE